MDRVLSPKSLPSPECVSDAEEKEISDDDDRNHKHRRRDNQSHSLEADAGVEDLFTPLRKRNKPFDNGFSVREGVTQSNVTWRNFNISPLDKGLSAKIDRRTGFTTIARAFDVNKKIKLNHAFSEDFGSGRGRGCSGNWSQRDSKFNSMPIASQMIHQGSVHPRLIVGRGGLPTVSSASATSSWGDYGLISGIPGGRMDTLHSLGLQGTIGSSMNPSLSIGIPRQRCRDFEERGFCLRGDMCPMEHGVNRIVIEDVQSLSQFNLPVSLPSVHMLGTTTGSRAFPLISTSSSIMNIKGKQNKSSKIGIVDKSNINMAGSFSNNAAPDCADLYDPDQPLWNNDSSEASTALLNLHSSKVCNMVAMPSDTEITDHERPHEIKPEGVMDGTNAAFGRLQCIDSSLIRRGHGSKPQETNINKPTKLSFVITPTKVREGADQLIGGDMLHHRNRTGAEDFASESTNIPCRKSNMGHDSINSLKTATKTLFVCGLPEINEKRSALLSHFRKFGTVVDISIPIKGGRAFIQFSKREEAEAAVMSPDAVMGNRFIKVLWAYRDTICRESSLCRNDELKPSLDIMPIPVSPQLSNYNAINDNVHYGNQKPRAHGFDLSSASSASRTSNSKVSSPPQKKLMNFHLLKELRKKQELLDQKRIEFSRQLHKFEKAKCGKVDLSAELCSPKPKAILNEQIKNSDKKFTAPPSVSVTNVMKEAKNKSQNIFLSQDSIRCSTTGVNEHMDLKKSQFSPVGTSFLPHLLKLDNHPTSFQIISPLPPSFEDAKCGKVDVLAELSSPKSKAILNEQIKSSDMKFTAPPTVSVTDVVKEANNKSHTIFLSQGSIRRSTTGVHDHTDLKRSQFSPVGTSFLPHPFKLDNRPTSFQIIPPLPPSFEDVDVLKEHFLSFSDLSIVELDDVESENSQNAFGTTRRCSARITFATHVSAENAFRNGRCWKGFNLDFKWVKHSDSSHWKSGKRCHSVSSSNTNSATSEKILEEVSENEGNECLVEKKSVGDVFVKNEADSSSTIMPMSCQKDPPPVSGC